MKHYLIAFARKPKLAMLFLKNIIRIGCFFLVVNSLAAQTISLNGPCTCREIAPGSQGNATNLENGQFIDTIQVNSNDGELWYIASTDEFFDVASPQPPFTPLFYMTGAAGAILTETSAGVYILPGVHIDALGYTISVTNGTDTLTISNTCAYPNPKITSEIKAGYCPNNAPVFLTANAGNSTGTGVFDVLAADLETVVQTNINIFDPSSLALGTYFLRYTFDEDDAAVLPCTNCNPGCVQAILEEIDIVTLPLSFACNDEVIVALGTNCDGEVLPDMVLEGDQDSYGIFDVNVFQNGVNIGNTVDDNQIGINLMAQVVDNCSGNSCMTVLTVLDNLAPVIACPTDPLQIVCTEDPNNIPAPTAVDACEGVVVVDLLMEMEENFTCGDANDVVRRIFRTFSATDSYGNSGMNCLQTIEMLKVGLADVVLPPNLDDDQAPALECTTTNTDPTNTGFPTINGLPIDGNDFCTISATSIDQFLAGCGGSSKILRNWTVYDYCEPTVSGINPILFTQTIKIKDNTSPTIIAPADVTISASNNNCTGNIDLLPAAVTDICSSFSVSTVSSLGFIDANGGLLTNLPLGIHLIVYTAIDDCGNQASDQLLVTVIDDVEPVAVCDEITAVAIDENGIGIVPAITLDDGSFDNCTGVSFLIRRLDGLLNFASTAIFDCSDIGQTIMVQLQILDENDNANTCDIEVNVQNEVVPLITCPAAITIDCSEDTGISNTGNATVVSNCAFLPNPPNDIITNLNDCGLGFLIREFSVVDGAGNGTNCQQTITIENGNPLVVSQISFPADYAISECTSSSDLLPQNLPASPINYGFPIVNNTSCADLYTGYIDEIFDLNANSNVCYKILRTYTILDWCDAVVVSFSESQIIEVTDNTAPVLTCSADMTISLDGGNCDTEILLIPPAVDECNDSLNVSFAVVSGFGVGFGPFQNVTADIYTVTYFAQDNCGNQSNCNQTITIEEIEPPLFTCNDDIPLTIGDDGSLTINASIFNSGSTDNCTAPEDLLFSFTPNPLDASLVFSCADADMPIFVTVWATDEAGNQSICSIDFTISGNVLACDDLLVAVTGMVLTEEDFPIEHVTVSVSGTTDPTMTTTDNGIFAFEELPNGGDFTITPTKELAVGNGVTGLDLVLISRHILGTQPLSSPYKMIAADANKSGTISTTDVVALRKIILQITDSLPNDNTSWRFVPTDYEFSNSNNPFANVFPEVVNFNNVTEPMTADFIGIKIGDVNCSANPSNLLATDDRNGAEKMMIVFEDRVVVAGEIFTVDFAMKDKQLPSSLQFGLQFSEKVEFVEINPQAWMQAENLGMSEILEGELKTCWQGISPNLQDPVLSLVFKATETAQLSEVFKMEEEVLKSEAVFDEDTYIVEPIELGFLTPARNINSGDWRVLQNAPNPFQTNTKIEVFLEQPSFAKLTVRDVFGKQVYQQKAKFAKNSNFFMVNQEDLSKTGIYFYEVETKFGKQSGKMILIK